MKFYGPRAGWKREGGFANIGPRSYRQGPDPMLEHAEKIFRSVPRDLISFLTHPSATRVIVVLLRPQNGSRSPWLIIGKPPFSSRRISLSSHKYRERGRANRCTTLTRFSGRDERAHPASSSRFGALVSANGRISSWARRQPK